MEEQGNLAKRCDGDDVPMKMSQSGMKSWQQCLGRLRPGKLSEYWLGEILLLPASTKLLVARQRGDLLSPASSWSKPQEYHTSGNTYNNP